MIPFASQRGLGQDLATHLLNAQQNEMIEILEVRGSVADDLHGAFAEWAFQADALTKCENYLYSLSINPDKRQGELSRAQYFDYIRRVDEKLGLTDQPRAVVCHRKYGREHYHVVWSRIDTEKEKAVHLSYDKEKLMVVTKQFARDHHLELPKGYYTDTHGKQQTLYQLNQKRITGLSEDQHQEIVTDLWRQSDSPKAFVQALAEQGYVLATGKRPYVLVDFFGGYHALPRLLDDKSIRTKDIVAFLEKDFPKSDLPTVEDAKALVDAHRNELEKFFVSEREQEALAELKARQDERRKDLELERKEMKKIHHAAREATAIKHRSERMLLKATYRAESKRIKLERYAKKPKGLPAFLGRVSGVSWVVKQVQKLEDRKRQVAFRNEFTDLKSKQIEEKVIQERIQELRLVRLSAKIKNMYKVDAREKKSVLEELKRELRETKRGSKELMPSLTHLVQKEEQKKRDQNKTTVQSLEQDFNDAVNNIVRTKDFDLTEEFTKAAKPEKRKRRTDQEEQAHEHEEHQRPTRTRKRRKRNRDLDRGR